MQNLSLLVSLLERYEKLAYTNEYMLGFADKGVVYVAKCNADMLPYVVTLDRVASNRVGGYSLRFKPNKAQKELLKTCDLYALCSIDYFENLFTTTKYNRGEIFEKLVTEHYGQRWSKDNVPFTESGDIVIDGTHYQIKYQKATFANEVTLANLER